MLPEINVGNQEPVAYKSFLDTLPSDVVPFVVRNISERPTSKDWLSYCDHGDVFAVLGHQGVLKRTGREMFTEMRLGLGKCLLHQLHSVEVVSKAFMQTQARYIDSLSIDNWGARVCMNSEAMGNCVNLRKLTLNQDIVLHYNYAKFHILFQACAKTLLELIIQVSDKASLRDLVKYAAKYCRVLEVVDIREITDISTIRALCEANQKTLRSLCLGNKVTKWKCEDLQSIANKCLKLSSLAVPRSVAVRMSEYLDSQLRVLTITCEHWDVNVLATVLERCDNAMVDGTVLFGADMLRVCAGRIRRLKLNPKLFTYAELEGISGSVRKSFDSLRSLQQLGIELEGELSPKLMDSLFAKKKKQLEKIELIGYTDGTVLKKIAESTNAVREFKCTTSKQLSRNDWESLLAANRKLAHVEITLTKGDPSEVSNLEKQTGELIRSLEHNTSLYNLIIKNDDEVNYMNKRSALLEDACVSMRWRDIGIEVGGVRYLPVHKPVGSRAMMRLPVT